MTAGLIHLQAPSERDLFAPEPAWGEAEEDISASLAEHLLGQVKDMPGQLRPVLRIELGSPPSPGIDARLRRALADRAALESQRLRELFRFGRRALVLGLAVLGGCLALAIHGQEVLPGLALPTIVKEGAKIIGWVSMWRPMEIFLYEWMPIQRRRKLFERLAGATIEIHPHGA